MIRRRLPSRGVLRGRIVRLEPTLLQIDTGGRGRPSESEQSDKSGGIVLDNKSVCDPHVPKALLLTLGTSYGICRQMRHLIPFLLSGSGAVAAHCSRWFLFFSDLKSLNGLRVSVDRTG